ncbi:retrovirus-related pol polyprotein from transposon TNT 1-94 [Tanacetum coccineum]
MEGIIRRLDSKTQYDVLIRRFDRSYPTGGYGVLDESIDSALARFNTIITSLKALDEDLASLSLDELIGNLKVHEMIIKKDSEILKAKGERRCLTLKAKKESSDEECPTSGCEDKEYAMAVKDFKKFFKRRECPKPPKDKNQRAFVGGSWSNNGEEDDEKTKDETCLVAQASNEVCSVSTYFSDDISWVDDIKFDSEFYKFCKICFKSILKNKQLKKAKNKLEKELNELKEKLSTLEKNKGVDLKCTKCQILKIDNEKLKEEALKLTQFEKSTHSLNEMLSNQKSSGDKLGIGFNSFETSTSETKEIKFMKSDNETPSGGGPPKTKGGQICDNKCRVTLSEHDSEITKDCKVIGRVSKELVRNLPKLKFDQHFYDACKMGKQAYASHKAKKIVSTTRCLELLHMDLFGPSAVQSYGGNLDDYSEPKNVNEALKDESWIIAMQEELNLFVANDVWELVAQYYNQQDGIDYDETYASVARLEFIRILLAYACALDFKLFQMDVKSAFLNSFINEEVYVAQPPGFIEFEKPDHVYKLKKALYGLKQEPKAWYDRLKDFLIKHEYKMGMVDNTLFTKKKSSNLIIVQIYVDDIIFGLTCQDMCDEFAKIMHDEFEMSMMGELNFFFGLQIKQMEDGIFFNQSKYIKEMLKKFGLEDSKLMKTPMSSDTKLMKDEECESVDSTKYQGMICSLLYLTASRPDIMFSVCLCARF